MGETMHAVVMHERGEPSVLRYEQVARPEPAAGEVLVEVHAATVNRTDLFHRAGRFFIQKPLPHILGMDVAGVVARVGPAVAGWEAGDRVVATFEALGRERDGAYAEFTTVPADQLRRVPDGLDLVAAASVGLAFTTAWVALRRRARLTADDRLAVTAAASGVGTSALQIGRGLGARTVALTDPDKADRLRHLADVVVDRTATDLGAQVRVATGGDGPTVVLELVGRATLRSSVSMLAPWGRVVCVGTLSGDLAELDVMELLMKNGSVLGSFGAVTPQEHAEILDRFADGSFQPVVDRVEPLSRARAAHEHLESGASFGKVVLVPDGKLPASS